jgi:hypothetical protein
MLALADAGFAVGDEEIPLSSASIAPLIRSLSSLSSVKIF